MRPHGWLGLVLPDPLLARTNAARERARLLKEFTIHHLWHLADVFAAHVGAVVIIAQKCPPPNTHQISWVREKWQKTLIGDSVAFTSGECHGIPDQIIPQSLLLHQPGAELRYLLSTEQGPTIERLRAYFDEPPASQRRLAPLSDFVSIRRGEELGMGNSLLIHEDQIFDENRVTCSPNKGRATTRALPAAPHPARPYDTTKLSRAASCIVGAGEDVDVGMGPLWSPVRCLSSPMDPEKSVVDLRLPDLPGMKAVLYIKVIGDMQFIEFLHESPGIVIVRLIFRCSSNIHMQSPGLLLYWQHNERTVLAHISSVIAPDAPFGAIISSK